MRDQQSFEFHDAVSWPCAGRPNGRCFGLVINHGVPNEDGCIQVRESRIPGTGLAEPIFVSVSVLKNERVDTWRKRNF
jgi:hypothetical protein